MPKVTFVKEKMDIEVPHGANLREEAMKAGLEVYQGINRYVNCFGNGQCARVRSSSRKAWRTSAPKVPWRSSRFGECCRSSGTSGIALWLVSVKFSAIAPSKPPPAMPISPEPDPKGKFFWETPYPNK